MKNKIEQGIIDAMIAHIESECSAVDTDKLYDDILDECSSCCDMCKQYGASRILKELDPTAYRCGKNDYIDGCDITEVNGTEYHDRDLDKAKDEFIDGLRDELSDLEKERDDIEEESEGAESSELRDINSKIEEKEAEIKECEQHSF